MNEERLKDILRDIVRNLGLLEKNKEFCCGITYAQYCAIIEIGRAKEIFFKDLSEKLKLDKSTTSRTVDNLVKLNYAQLDTYTENRRFIKITLTNEGQKLFESIENGATQYYKNILELIPEDKRDQLVESLEYLLSAISKVKCCDVSCCSSNK